MIPSTKEIQMKIFLSMITALVIFTVANVSAEVMVTGSWKTSQFKKIAKEFNQSHPGIKLNYIRATKHDRIVKPLMKFGISGKYMYDVIESIPDITPFMKLGMLHDLSGLKNWNTQERSIKSNHVIAYKRQIYCLGYNTNLVKKADLPTSWTDLHSLNVPFGLANRILMFTILWSSQGEKVGKAIINSVFNTKQLVRHAKGLTLLNSLVAAGEYSVGLPIGYDHYLRLVRKGAPMGFHCPAIIPNNISYAVVMNSENAKDALKYVDWVISLEGQTFLSRWILPVHKDLQIYNGKDTALREELIGKTLVSHPIDTPKNNKKLINQVRKYWKAKWQK